MIIYYESINIYNLIMKSLFILTLLLLATFGTSCDSEDCGNQNGRVWMKTIMCRNMGVNHCLIRKDIKDVCARQEIDCITLLNTLDSSFDNNYRIICTDYNGGLYLDCKVTDLQSSSNRITPLLITSLLIGVVFFIF
jgi:hypothetical protein